MKAPYGRTQRDTKGRRQRSGRHGLPGAVMMAARLFAVLAAMLGPRAALAAMPVGGPAEGSAGAPPRTIRILAFGDSLTAGYGLPHAEGFVAQLQSKLDQADAHATVLDAGVSGDTSAGGVARLDWALGDHADAAIVELGANDGLRGLDPKQLEHNLAAILDRLRAQRIPVLLSGMYAPPNLGAGYGQAFRSVYDRLSRRPGLLYDPFFLAGVAGDHTLNQADGIHPLPAGVALIVRRLTPLVLQLIAQARAGSPG